MEAMAVCLFLEAVNLQWERIFANTVRRVKRLTSFVFNQCKLRGGFMERMVHIFPSLSLTTSFRWSEWLKG
jgi:hypothetical protein